MDWRTCIGNDGASLLKKERTVVPISWAFFGMPSFSVLYLNVSHGVFLIHLNCGEDSRAGSVPACSNSSRPERRREVPLPQESDAPREERCLPMTRFLRPGQADKVFKS